jgi:hypothetical protein
MVEKIRRTVELPADLYAELEATAAQDERSINAELIWALRQWLAGRRTASRRAPPRTKGRSDGS